MQDTGTNSLHQTAMPLADWIATEQIIVFVVSTGEQRGKGAGLQPIQPPLLRIAAIPDTAEVSTDDEVILFGQVTLFGEGRRMEPTEIAVRITVIKIAILFLPFYSF